MISSLFRHEPVLWGRPRHWRMKFFQYSSVGIHFKFIGFVSQFLIFTISVTWCDRNTLEARIGNFFFILFLIIVYVILEYWKSYHASQPQLGLQTMLCVLKNIFRIYCGWKLIEKSNPKINPVVHFLSCIKIMYSSGFALRIIFLALYELNLLWTVELRRTCLQHYFLNFQKSLMYVLT